MNNYNFISQFSKDFEILINEKSSTLIKINSYIIYLKQFDLFINANYKEADYLSEEIIKEWLKLREKECSLTRSSRATIIRQLAKSMIKRDKTLYLIPNGSYKQIKEHVPYIFNNEEIKRIINTVESMEYNPLYFHQKLMFPLIIKLLICCGFRIGDLLNLKVEDVLLERSIIRIIDGKEDIDRLIPLNNELLVLCKEYHDCIKESKTKDDYFFSMTNKNNRIVSSTQHKIFRKILASSSIKYLGIHKGPRIHDFRFTYVVNCVQKFIRDGKDINIYLPIIQKYLGHSTLDDSLYYYKPKEKVFLNILKCEENIVPDIKEVVLDEE